ncbi:MAG TPA: DUF1080 domain-containing protein [Pirellulales bacterium]|nr:DUF1080 domain-containing protein [Pirellulales bacterium]
MIRPRLISALVFLTSIVGPLVALRAADSSPLVATKAADAGPDYQVQGEYVGEITGKNNPDHIGGHVVALGDGKFDVFVYPGGLPGAGWKQRGRLYHVGETKNGVTAIAGQERTGKIDKGVATIFDLAGNKIGELKRIERTSPTLGAKPPAGAIVLFDGTSADKWNGGRLSDDGLLEVGCTSKQSFKDFQLHIEFQTPFMPKARGQGRGNSGVYLQNRYEVQVLDSFGLEGQDNECGGFYSIKKPDVNMCFPPLAWQTYDIDFTAARFDDAGNKTKNAVVTVRHNGVPIHENFELPKLTPGGAPQEAPGEGPLQLQNHGNPVRFRNIWVVEKKS